MKRREERDKLEKATRKMADFVVVQVQNFHFCALIKRRRDLFDDVKRQIEASQALKEGKVKKLKLKLKFKLLIIIIIE